MPTAAWASLDDWRDRPRDEATATRLLAAAQEQCEAFAPLLVAGSPVPARYTQAVILQARELANAASRDSADTIGADGYAIRVRPLTGAVRQLLRPPRVLGAAG
jgi:hypothetical protein